MTDENDFYVEDEPIEDVRAILARPPDGFTTTRKEPLMPLWYDTICAVMLVAACALVAWMIQPNF